MNASPIPVQPNNDKPIPTQANSSSHPDKVIPTLPSLPSSSPANNPIVDGKLRFETYLAIHKEYKRQFNCAFVYCNNQGELLYGFPDCRPFPCGKCCAENRRRVLEDAFNSGKPVLHLCSGNYRMWGVPVMFNNLLCGGLVVTGVNYTPTFGKAAIEDQEMEPACQGLVSIAVKYNIVNESYLERRRDRMLRMDEFTSPSSLETDTISSKLLSFLSDKEPKILANIRNNDKRAAQENLEEIAQVISRLPQDHLCLAKGLALDLLIAVDHASMETGTDFATMMRFNCALSKEVHKIESPRALSQFLEQTLAQAFNIKSPYHKNQEDVTLKNIISYIEKNYNKTLRRETIAARFGISVSGLSHLLNQKMGQSFIEILNRIRSDRAAQLLRSTKKSLVDISFECGFQDQSYFGKVFRNHYGCSPGQYRKEYTQTGNLGLCG